MIGSAESFPASPGWRDRLAARMAALRPGRMAPRRPPDPFPAGDVARAQEMLKRDAKGGSGGVGEAGFWTVVAPPGAFEAARQGFDWLEDLAALGTPRAREAARARTAHWLATQGGGGGAGWTLPLATLRLGRLMAAADWLAAPGGALGPAPLARAFAIHVRFAQARLSVLAPDAGGLAIAARLVACASGLDGGHELRTRAQRRLELAAERVIAADGSVADRCPETLATLFVDLAWASRALASAGLDPLPGHAAAIVRAAPVLRALRHGDGSLPRFHGGGAGVPARIDAALVASAERPGPAPARPMGYAVLRRGRTSLVADAAPPPGGAAVLTAHASALAIEVQVGRAPVLVNCGAAGRFGPDWHRAVRATASHSTLSLAGPEEAAAAAGLAPARPRGAAALLRDPARDVKADLQADGPDAWLSMAHDGFAARFGLIHARRIDLTLDGGQITGEDLLTPVPPAMRSRDRRAVPPTVRQRFDLRFHLHPSIAAAKEAGGSRIVLRLPGGDRWTFRAGAGVTMRLDPSIYLENTRAEPVQTLQIVLEGLTRQGITTVTWRLARDAESPAFRRMAPRDVPEAETTETAGPTPPAEDRP